MSLILANNSPRAALTNEQQYRLLFAATFFLFLGAAIVRRMFRRMTGEVRPAGTRMSLVAEAKATGYSSLAFAFMG